VDIGDTVKRIDGTEVPILTPWLGKSAKAPTKAPAKSAVKAAVEPDAAAKAVKKTTKKAEAKAETAPATEKKPRATRARKTETE
jgi:NADH-quinone oxidoreductase subunit E